MLLGLTLVLNYFVPITAFAGLPSFLEKIAATAFLSLPLLFSGFTFSAELRRIRDIPINSALSSNLLGAMLGGFCEYNSMYFGYQSLYVFALVFYALAFSSSSILTPYK